MEHVQGIVRGNLGVKYEGETAAVCGVANAEEETDS